MEKYQQLIDAKQFDKVIELLNGASDEVSLKFLILAYFGKQNFDKVIELIDSGLKLDHKNYYWLIRHKIEALLELQEFEKTLNLVEQEAKMPYIPKDYVEYFTTLSTQLKNQLKLKSQKDKLSSLDDSSFVDLLLNEKDEMNLLVLVDQFNYRNVRTMLDGLKQFYLLKRVPNYIKMSLTEVLKDQQLDVNFKLANSAGLYEVNPIKVTPLFEQENFKKAVTLVDDSPLKLPVSQKEIVYELIITYLANLFPQFLLNEDVKLLAAASMILSYEMLGSANKQAEVLHYTGVKLVELNSLLTQLKLLI